MYLYEHLPIYKITACPDCSILVVANLPQAYGSRNTGHPQFKPAAGLWLERDRMSPTYRKPVAGPWLEISQPVPGSSGL